MTNLNHGLTRLDKLMKHCVDGTMEQTGEVLPQTFGRLLPETQNPLQWSGDSQDLVAIFETMIDAMRVEDTDADALAGGPAEAGMTFLGQFIDHDVTFDATSSIGRAIDPRFIRNIRTPGLDLDCVYGDGPEASPHLYVNPNQHPDLHDAEGFMLYGRVDNPYDLARNAQGTALIGDPRNDENIFVSQVHGAFVALHNILMSHMAEGGDVMSEVVECAEMGMSSDLWEEAIIPKLKDFEAVRRFIRLHYQWLIIHRFLPAFVTEAALEKARHPDAFPAEAAVMPVEFSGATYRFGHATAQLSYALREGAEPTRFFEQRGFVRRPTSFNLDMNMMFDMDGQVAPRARAVSTKVAGPLFEWPFVGADLTFPGVVIPRESAAKLPLRNVVRDRFALEIASGQQVANHLGLQPLNVPAALADANITKTPLWFYALEEADASGQGKLDGAGGTIVAWVLLRLLRLDKTSVLHQPHFKPWSGFGGEDMTMGDLMSFVETHRDSVKHRERLLAG